MLAEACGAFHALYKLVGDFTANQLCGFVGDVVEPGSTVRTDGLNSYLVLPRYGYVHDRIVQKKHVETASKLLPGVHLVASLLKRRLLGTHQGRVSREHLGYYLDEFTFRFNSATHDPLGGDECDTEQLAAEILALENKIDGVSISGGEPFQQPEALRDLLERLLRAGLSRLVFTGYTLCDIIRLQLPPSASKDRHDQRWRR